ncbi:MAG: hypothetical protein ACYCW6_14535 [Candidatus Xenobia bacterium]
MFYVLLIFYAGQSAARACYGRNACIDTNSYRTRIILMALGRIHLPMLLTGGLAWLLWRTAPDGPALLASFQHAVLDLAGVLVPYTAVCELLPFFGRLGPRDFHCTLSQLSHTWPELRMLTVLAAGIFAMAQEPRYEVLMVVGFLTSALLNFDNEILRAVPFESESTS